MTQLIGEENCVSQGGRYEYILYRSEVSRLYCMKARDVNVFDCVR
jgi:hypothetical protein